MLELAELSDIPVVTTLMARGAFPDSHDLCLGMPGMHGNYTAVTSMQQSDLLIALGSRFDDRITGRLDGFAPDAKVIHVDIDPAELGKVRRPDVPIVGDCRLVIEEMVKVLRARLDDCAAFPDRSGWRSRISGWQEKYPLHYEQSEPGELLKPQYVLEQLRDQVLFLKHNLNAQALGSLEQTSDALQADVGALIAEMNKSIDEADRFIAEMKPAE